MSSNMFDASSWEGGECGGQCCWTVTLRDSKNSNLCDRETQENAHMREVGGKDRQC